MFQVLKSPRSTEEPRIKDLASHIHRSQFRFSNSNRTPASAASFIFAPNFWGSLEE